MDLQKGLIIVTHPILADITQTEVVAALPSEWLIIPREFCVIDPVTVKHHDIYSINWREAAGTQVRQVNERLLPLIKKYPDYLVCYFGAAPIPLAIHLGYRLGTWKRVMVFQQHHKRKDWRWLADEDKLIIHKEGFPKESFLGEGEAILRLGSSFPVSKEDTKTLVPKSVRELDVFTEPYDLDVFNSSANLSQFADVFRDGIESIKNHLPNTQLIHLFSAIPVGLSFLLGTRINPTIHPRIQTYQYYQDKFPRYQAALVVQDEGPAERIITEEQKAKASELRQEIVKMFNAQLIPFLNQLTDTHSRESNLASWIETLLPQGTAITPFLSSRWNQLPHVFDTILKNSKIDSDITNSQDFYVAGMWLLDDEFLTTLIERLDDWEDVKRAIRLFFFHEAAHFRTHGLTNTTALEIGRFARILEEVDYQADVWAMLHEYAFSKMFDVTRVNDVCDFFHHLITLATETMWSFDMQEDPDVMQSRRINRYLIWYFHFVQIEHENCKTLNDVLQHLSEKPLLELKGLRLNSPDNAQRIWCRLNDPNQSELEIAILYHNRIRRFSNGTVMPITFLLDGLRGRDGQKIKHTLKSLLDQVT